MLFVLFMIIKLRKINTYYLKNIYIKIYVNNFRKKIVNP